MEQELKDLLDEGYMEKKESREYLRDLNRVRRLENKAIKELARMGERNDNEPYS